MSCTFMETVQGLNTYEEQLIAYFKILQKEKLTTTISDPLTGLARS